MAKNKIIVTFLNDLHTGGGAQAVCMNVLESLQQDYQVKLMTTREPDLEKLNSYYGTTVSNIQINVVSFGPFEIQHLIDKTDSLLLRLPGPSIYLIPITKIILYQMCRRKLPDGNMIITTMYDFPFANNSIQYVHFPFYWQNLHPSISKESPDQESKSETRSLLLKCLGKFYRVLGGFNSELFNNSRILVNSEWTAGTLKSVYDVSVDIVHPPIQTADFSSRLSVSEKEKGFVSIGRVSPQKNILRNIRILNEVRECGHDIHYHIIGPTGESKYAEQVEKMAADLDFVSLEGKLSRSQFVDMLECHRFGIHGNDTEHFGIGVAEMVAAGVLPFVPDGGGQREIINNLSPLVYKSPSEAVEKIDYVLSNATFENELRDKLPDIEERYDKSKFKKQIQKIVREEMTM